MEFNLSSFRFQKVNGKWITNDIRIHHPLIQKFLIEKFAKEGIECSISANKLDFATIEDEAMWIMHNGI